MMHICIIIHANDALPYFILSSCMYILSIQVMYNADHNVIPQKHYCMAAQCMYNKIIIVIIIIIIIIETSAMMEAHSGSK